MVTLTIDNETYDALRKQAAARGLSVEEWLKCQSFADRGRQPSPLPFGQQMAELFSQIGLTDDESIPELKGQPVRSPEFK